MTDLKEKLLQMKDRYARQLEGCEAKLEALALQKEQLKGAIFAINQALVEDNSQQTREEKKES